MRRGVAIVLVMAIVLLCAFFTGVFFFLARGETDRTVVQAREIQATLIGEGVAARIGAMVERLPWNDRFYKALGGGAEPAVYAFTHRKFPFDRRQGPFGTGEASFSGIVKDLKVAGSYRVMAEIVYQGQKVLMTFDRQYPQSLLSVGGEDGSLLASHQDPGASGLDSFIDATRDFARQNRGDGPFRGGPLLTGVDGTLTDRRSGRNPGREILWGKK